MEREDDVQLIHDILSGDEAAFAVLVQKYQKSVHALVWRKIGDFHHAEEITQDTFLRAYRNLSTLKNPNQFAGWLYVIANRLCINWHRKQKPKMQSLEDTPVADIEKSSHTHHVLEQREKENTQHRHELVKNLLEKLPESERTVMTLYYLGEMTTKEIGKFLGVSVNTISSRLRRARNRLKEQEDMIRETLGSVHLPKTFTENIMRQIAEIQPVSPTSSSPSVPVALSAVTAIFIFFIMGVGSQYLARFQKPYNLSAQSEITVEIIDAPIVLNTNAEPDLRNQTGRSDTMGKGKGSGPEVSEPAMLAAAQEEKETRPSTDQQWKQASGPKVDRSVLSLLASSWGDVYAASSGAVYRLTPGASAWTFVSSVTPTSYLGTPGDYRGTALAEYNDALYIVFADSVFASKDNGETWEKLGERPNGRVIGLVVTDDAFYLALRNEGIFRSTDAGKQWTPIKNENDNEKIDEIAAVENTVFVRTDKGLYRLNSETWEKLSIDTTKSLRSLAVSGNDIYVGTGLDLSILATPGGEEAYKELLMRHVTSNTNSWKIFHSTDLGDSWTDITPTSNALEMKTSSGVQVLAVGKAVMALGMVSFNSTDNGKTWTEFGRNPDAMGALTAVAVDENTILKAGPFEPQRSIDGGDSWHPFADGIVGTGRYKLVAFKNALYMDAVRGVIKSTNGGESWKNVPMPSSEITLKSTEATDFTESLIFPKFTIVGDTLYGIAPTKYRENAYRIFHLSTNKRMLIPIQGTPPFPGNSFKADPMRPSEKYPSAFASDGETFYVEYMRQLLRWKRGESEWFNTGLTDTGESLDRGNNIGFKLAVSGKTVYVGKREGQLFQSDDSGDTWNDLTSDLPLRFERFNAIVFAGPTVYVATDAGVLTSEDGEHWRVITDQAGTYTLIDQIAVSGRTVYGAGDDGVYELNKSNKWEKISPQVPDNVISLVINNDSLYIGTERRGMFYISLEKAIDAILR